MARTDGPTRTRHRRADDVSAADETNDDDVGREVDRVTRRAEARTGDPLAPPFNPLRADEVVCRRCRLVVRRRLPDGVPLLVCDDCRW